MVGSCDLGLCDQIEGADHDTLALGFVQAPQDQILRFVHQLSIWYCEHLPRDF